jgi:hypothetical protein
VTLLNRGMLVSTISAESVGFESPPAEQLN